MRFEDLQIGQSAEFEKAISDEDISMFARATGDFNPVHLDEEIAAKSRFKGRIAHGMLSAGVISAAIAGHFPGSIYMSQSLRFTAPVRIGDKVTARIEIIEVMAPKRRVRLATVCTNQNGEKVVDGEALVLIPPAESES
jgi:3-hydroxybutyryl-CoA dehydratase